MANTPYIRCNQKQFFSKDLLIFIRPDTTSAALSIHKIIRVATSGMNFRFSWNESNFSTSSPAYFQLTFNHLGISLKRIDQDCSFIESSGTVVLFVSLEYGSIWPCYTTPGFLHLSYRPYGILRQGEKGATSTFWSMFHGALMRWSLLNSNPPFIYDNAIPFIY